MTFQLDTETSIDSDLRKQMLCLRKAVFCDALGWDIPHCGGQEADIFDFNKCFYLNWIDPETGVLLGSVRLLPYARDNLMNTVFKNTIDPQRSAEFRQQKRVWEGTRLCINEKFFEANLRPNAIVTLLLGLFNACKATGIEKLLCNCNRLMHRLYRNFGLEFECMGDTSEFRHGEVHCLGFPISEKNFRVLRELAEQRNLEWPEIEGRGVLAARSFTTPTPKRIPLPDVIPAPMSSPVAEPMPLRAHA